MGFCPADRISLFRRCGIAGNCPLRQHHHTHRPLGQSAAERHEAAARGTWPAAAEVNLLGGTDPALPRTGWTAAADSQETVKENGAAANVLDGNTATIWHTAYGTPPAAPPRPPRSTRGSPGTSG
jgi:hypothetical protein